MTNDPVDAVITAFLDHLENGGPEPPLEDLTPADRVRAEELINIIRSGHGIDVYQSRPSLNALLAGTEFEEWVNPPVTAGLTVDAIRTDAISALGGPAEPFADSAASSEGVRSDAVIVYRGLRLRVQFREDISTSAELAQVDPRIAAGAIYGRFRDTAGVILVMGDAELSSVPIGPFDTDHYVGTPDGHLHAPRITRPVLPLFDTLRSYIDEVAPDLVATADYTAPDAVDGPDIIRSAAIAACGVVVAEGTRSRTQAKKDTWTKFGDTGEVEVVAGIVADVMSGDLSPEAIKARVDIALSAA